MIDAENMSGGGAEVMVSVLSIEGPYDVAEQGDGRFVVTRPTGTSRSCKHLETALRLCAALNEAYAAGASSRGSAT